MSKLSTSFTVGKASAIHGANVEHNNREFFADNIDVKRIVDNITYVKQDVREAYNELFGKALEEYNARQKQPCRRIGDYYEHISSGKREEAFYEIIVQFGDSKIAPVGSENGELAKKLLDEYMKSFEKRNPNLHIFNAVLHLDEASPHLHINFVPFYKESRKNGLSKGVSFRAALDEQGFTNSNVKMNSLILWQDSERDVMVDILNRHGLERDIKKAAHSHQTVEAYKETRDLKKIPKRSKKNLSPEELAAENLRNLELKNSLLEIEKKKLNEQKHSPYKSFYYSVPEKQSFVQSKLQELKIPYRETENGFEAQECYIEQIRKLEKEFTPVKNPHRDKLRENLDRIIMQSKNYDEVLYRLEKADYQVKQGKYISVKPKYSSQFIRLKSLGEDYSEVSIRNRIIAKLKFERDIDGKINSSQNQDSLTVIIQKTMKHYTVIFSQGLLPVRKINKKKPFSWTNDAELDRLSALNKKINAGATLENLRSEFESLEISVSEKEAKLKDLQSGLKLFRNLRNASKRCFELGEINQADLDLLTDNKVTQDNYHRLDNIFPITETKIAELEKSLPEEREKLKDVSDTLAVMEKIESGTFMQSLIDDERNRRQSEYVMNGLKRAD